MGNPCCRLITPLCNLFGAFHTDETAQTTTSHVEASTCAAWQLEESDGVLDSLIFLVVHEKTVTRIKLLMTSFVKHARVGPARTRRPLLSAVVFEVAPRRGVAAHASHNTHSLTAWGCSADNTRRRKSHARLAAGNCRASPGASSVRLCVLSTRITAAAMGEGDSFSIMPAHLSCTAPEAAKSLAGGVSRSPKGGSAHNKQHA